MCRHLVGEFFVLKSLTFKIDQADVQRPGHIVLERLQAIRDAREPLRESASGQSIQARLKLYEPMPHSPRNPSH